MGVAEGRQKYLSAKAAMEDYKHLISELQKKSDILEESLPSLNQAIEETDKVKTAALDNYALHGDKQSESELKRSRTAYEQAGKQRAETNELIESVARTLKRQESELIKLNSAVDLARRGCWQAVADEIKNNIPSHIFDAVRTLLVAGAQCSQTRQYILDSLFPNLPTADFQSIRGELCEKYNID